MPHTICLIEGDGIGPEVTAAARAVLDASGAELTWLPLAAGAAAAERFGDTIPEATLEAIRTHRIALKGPVTTPVGKGFTSVNVRLRKTFNLYAAVRPVRSLRGIRTRYENVEIVVIRENTEGLYSGIEHEVVPGVIETLKVTTKAGCERIARYAFAYARSRGRKKVTVFHKANIMKRADGLFLDCARRMHEEVAPEIALEELIIDNGCMQLVRDPSRFDVLLMENYNGDMVSDLCAGLVGGLGVVPGANIGDEGAIFEAVHGSAPDIAGKDIANPIATIASLAMMLKYSFGLQKESDAVEQAIVSVLEAGYRTADLKEEGKTTVGTKQIGDLIIERIG